MGRGVVIDIPQRRIEVTLRRGLLLPTAAVSVDAGPADLHVDAPAGAVDLPVEGTIVDYYLNGVSGVDGPGRGSGSWGNAFKTPAYAAAHVPDLSRILVAPATYTINSPITYSGKRLWWEGPPQTADQIQSYFGNAVFKASGSPARYFDISHAAAGGFKELCFSNRPVTTDIIRVRDVQNLVANQIHVQPTDPTTNSLVQHKPMFRFEGSSGEDCSGFELIDCDAHSSALIYAHLPVDVPAHGWRWISPYDQSDTGQNEAYLDVAGDFDQLYWEGSYLEMTNPAVKIDMRGVAGSRRVTAYPAGFERLTGSYHAAEFYNCQLTIGWGGGTNQHNGIIWGDSGCTGWVGVPSSRLAGSLVPGAN